MAAAADAASRGVPAANGAGRHVPVYSASSAVSDPEAPTELRVRRAADQASTYINFGGTVVINETTAGVGINKPVDISGTPSAPSAAFEHFGSA